MSDSTENKGLAGVTRNLQTTLEQEEATLSRLASLFDAQLDALRRRQQETLEQITLQVNEEVHALGRLRQARERQARLLGRLLKLPQDAEALQHLAEALSAIPGAMDQGRALLEARDRVRAQADEAKQRCDEFEFALHYAVRLGREMLQVIQDLDIPPPTRVYTARGKSTQATPPSSFLNQVG